MTGAPTASEPRADEIPIRALWHQLGMPPPNGRLGPERGALVWQILALPVGPEPGAQTWARLVAADTDARYLLLRQHSSRTEPCSRDSAPVPFPGPVIQERGIWIRTAIPESVPAPELASRVNGMTERLAASHVLVVRDAPMRLCPKCREPRAPEAVLYNAEKGPSYLVRFPLRGSTPPTSLLVWTDALWKLLGATAILVNPDLKYAVVHYRRRDVDDRVIVAEPALSRLAEWLPGASLEVLETKPGEELVDSIYDHPYGTDSPELAHLPGPAGSVLPSAEVGDSGTGIVALVPAHGASDGIVARSLRVPGFSVINPVTTRLVSGPPKYTDLPLAIGESMILHDLIGSGHLFAELRVRRGVPHCTICGGELIWAPGRTWCLEPGRMNDATAALFARLLPGEALPRSAETVPWPVAELAPSSAGDAPEFWECPVCERLGLPEEEATCSCGQTRQKVRRDLLPVFRRPMEAWARITPLAEGDSVRLYVTERRKYPTLMHHLVAIEAARVETKSVRAVPLATLPYVPEIPDLGPTEATDVFRATLLRAATADRTAWAFSQIRTQENRRHARLVATVRELAGELKSAGGADEPGSIVAHLPELLEEDRAFISLFERLRLEAIKLYESDQAGRAYERLAAFFEHDFRDTFLPLVGRRRRASSNPAELVSFQRTLLHILTRWIELVAPVLPFTSEQLSREVKDRPSSLFERPILPVVEAAFDPTLDRRYRQWLSLQTAEHALRLRLGTDPNAPWRRLVVLAATEDVAMDLNESIPVLRRITGAHEVEVASPEHPWTGRQLEVRPNVEEIRRVYPGRERRILRTLEQLPATRVRDALKADTLTIVLDSHSLPLRASMFEFGESIPPEFHPTVWRFGELLVSGTPAPDGAREPPLLTFDAGRLVERIRRDVARMEKRGTKASAVSVWTPGPIADELRKHGPSVSGYLGVERFEVAKDAKVFIPSERRKGRTRRGVPWSYWIPGGRLSRRPAKRRSRQRSPVRLAVVGDPEYHPTPSTDFSSEEIRARDGQVLALVEAADAALGSPLLGPAKALSAWEAGFHEPEQLLTAPYDRLVVLPGFGHYLAAEILHHRGESVPKRRRAGAESSAPVIEVAPGVPPEPTAPISEDVAALVEAAVLGDAAESDTAVPVDTGIADVREPAELLASARTASVSPGAGPAGTNRTVPDPSRPSPGSGGTAPRPAPTAVGVAAVAGVGVSAARPRPIGPVYAADQTPAIPTAPMSPPDSGIELVVGYSSEGAWRMFLDATSAGHRGLCFSRETPGRMRTFLGPRDVDIVWVSTLGQAESLSPSNIDGLRALLRQEIEERGVTAVYIEGFEYLVAIQTVDRAVAWLSELDTLAKNRTARVWIPLNPGLVLQPVYDRLVGAFRHVDSA